MSEEEDIYYGTFGHERAVIITLTIPQEINFLTAVPRWRGYVALRLKGGAVPALPAEWKQWAGVPEGLAWTDLVCWSADGVDFVAPDWYPEASPEDILIIGVRDNPTGALCSQPVVLSNDELACPGTLQVYSGAVSLGCRLGMWFPEGTRAEDVEVVHHFEETPWGSDGSDIGVSVEPAIFSMWGGDAADGLRPDVAAGEFDAGGLPGPETVNFLTKNVSRSLVTGTPGKLGTPPEYVYRTVWQVKRRQIAPQGGEVLIDISGAPPSQSFTIQTVGDKTYSYELLSRQELVSFKTGTPAIPGVPDLETVDRHIGWNAAARLLESTGTHGRVTFGVTRDVVGAVVGLSFGQASGGMGDLLAGLYVDSGRVHFVVGGQLAENMEELRVTAYSRLFLEADLVAGTIRAGLAATPGIELPLSLNQVVAMQASDTLYVQAQLYSGGDSIWDTRLELLSARETGQQLGMLPTLVGTSALNAPKHDPDAWRGHGVLAGITGIARSADLIVNPEPVWPMMQGVGQIGTFSQARAVSGEIASQGAGRLSGIGGYAAEGGYNFGLQLEGNIEISCVASGLDGSERANLFSAATGSAQLNAKVLFVAAVTSTGRLLGLMELRADEDHSQSDLLRAVSTMFATVSSGRSGSDWDVWVMNAETGAITRYENYGFTGFARVGNRYFGVRPEGIYLLEGNDDAGIPLEGRFAFGKLGFGSSSLKRIPNIYIDGASDQQLEVQVEVEGARYTYNARAESAHSQQQRVDCGRGLRATYFELQISGGCGDFEVNGMDVVVDASNRRI